MFKEKLPDEFIDTIAEEYNKVKLTWISFENYLMYRWHVYKKYARL